MPDPIVHKASAHPGFVARRPSFDNLCSVIQKQITAQKESETKVRKSLLRPILVHGMIKVGMSTDVEKAVSDVTDVSDLNTFVIDCSAFREIHSLFEAIANYWEEDSQACSRRHIVQRLQKAGGIVIFDHLDKWWHDDKEKDQTPGSEKDKKREFSVLLHFIRELAENNVVTVATVSGNLNIPQLPWLHCHLEPMGETEARELFESCIQDHGTFFEGEENQQAYQELLKETEGIPIVIMLLATNVQSYETATQLLAFWRDERKNFFGHLFPNGQCPLTNAVLVAFDLLSDRAKELFVLLCRLPSGLPADWIGIPDEKTPSRIAATVELLSLSSVGLVTSQQNKHSKAKTSGFTIRIPRPISKVFNDCSGKTIPLSVVALEWWKTISNQAFEHASQRWTLHSAKTTQEEAEAAATSSDCISLAQFAHLPGFELSRKEDILYADMRYGSPQLQVAAVEAMVAHAELIVKDRVGTDGLIDKALTTAGTLRPPRPDIEAAMLMAKADLASNKGAHQDADKFALLAENIARSLNDIDFQAYCLRRRAHWYESGGQLETASKLRAHAASLGKAKDKPSSSVWRQVMNWFREDG